MSYQGDNPHRLAPADVWKLLRDGFNAAEVAYIGGVAIETAEAMVAQARRGASRETTAFPQEASA